MTDDEIDTSKQSIASIPKAKRGFLFYQAAAAGEGVQKMLVLTATHTFVRQEYLTPRAPANFWHLNFAEWLNKMYQAI